MEWRGVFWQLTPLFPVPLCALAAKCVSIVCMWGWSERWPRQLWNVSFRKWLVSIPAVPLSLRRNGRVDNTLDAMLIGFNPITLEMAALVVPIWSIIWSPPIAVPDRVLYWSLLSTPSYLGKNSTLISEQVQMTVNKLLDWRSPYLMVESCRIFNK